MIHRLNTVTELPVDEIALEGRLRDVSESGVASLMDAIRARGFVGRIQVRRKPDGDVVMDGAHRLTAMRQLGETTIPVEVFKCNDAEARLFEVDGNLAGADLTALDTSVFLAARKRVYEELHPETRAGVAGATARWTDASDMMSFASATAEKFGLSKRHVERLVAAGDKLNAEEIARLRAAPRKVTLADLQAIAKIHTADERFDVVARLVEGRSKSAAEARRAWAMRDRPQTVISAKEAAYLKLINLWSQTTPGVRRQFVEDRAVELREMLAQLGGDK
ncbi:ParB/RepB/Spo0J family partition protein [Oceaniglobus trochenteri]|uniref:ParB/RepB/Spo0J family partition protein n=1 Tax=Oceaniglobus trochenteri TaxID=2763260 RepID=UPI001CFFA89C|nr:ParB N-terminal domain-containing protein [Oceaniglobus trochenteri]